MICRWCKKPFAVGLHVGLVRPHASDDPTAAWCAPEPACTCEKRQYWRHVMEGAALAMEKSGTDEEWKALNSVVIGEIYKGMEVGIKHVLANGKKALARRLADERRRERRVKRRQNGER